MLARSLLVALALTAPLALPMAARAGPECQCRSAGQIFEHGQLACIKTNDGLQLARCDMSQNVSSWTIVGKDCPQATSTPLPKPVAAIAAAFAAKSTRLN